MHQVRWAELEIETLSFVVHFLSGDFLTNPHLSFTVDLNPDLWTHGWSRQLIDPYSWLVQVLTGDRFRLLTVNWCYLLGLTRLRWDIRGLLELLMFWRMFDGFDFPGVSCFFVLFFRFLLLNSIWENKFCFLIKPVCFFSLIFLIFSLCFVVEFVSKSSLSSCKEICGK